MTIEDIAREMVRGQQQTPVTPQPQEVPAELIQPQAPAQPQPAMQQPQQQSPQVAASDIAKMMLAPNPLGQYAQTSEDFYQSVFDKVRANGGTTEDAQRIARREAAPYQANRVAALSQYFNTAGVTDDGAITQEGVGILSQLAQENPAQVNMLGNMYQTPSKQWQYAQDIAKMVMQGDIGLRNSREMAGVNFGYSQQAADAQMQRQMQLHQYKLNMDEALRQGRQNEAMSMAYNLAKASGATDQEAQVAALSYVISGGGGSGRSGRNGSSNGAATGNNQYSLKDLRDLAKFYRDQGMNEMGEWTNPQLKEAYDNAMSAILRYNETPIDTSNPDQVAMMVVRAAQESGLPVWKVLDKLKESYPDANFTGVAEKLGLPATNADGGMGGSWKIDNEGPKAAPNKPSAPTKEGYPANWDSQDVQKALGMDDTEDNEDEVTKNQEESVDEKRRKAFAYWTGDRYHRSGK